LLPVGVCVLLVWQGGNPFVALLENCGNHKNLQRPSKLKLDSGTGGCYAFLWIEELRLAVSQCFVKQEGSLAVFLFGEDNA
jgi:hypothetical protein